MKQYFDYGESIAYPEHYIIMPNFNKLPLTGTIGSYNVLAARVCGLSYAQFLKMCRDKYGAKLVGKGTIYGMAYFPKDKFSQMKSLINLLNSRTEEILTQLNK